MHDQSQAIVLRSPNPDVQEVNMEKTMSHKQEFETKEAVVIGEKQLQQQLLHLAQLSCWFEVTPLPDDQYSILVKKDVAHLAFARPQNTETVHINTATLAQLDWQVSIITNPDWSDLDRWMNTIGYVDSGDQEDEPYTPTTNPAQTWPLLVNKCSVIIWRSQLRSLIDVSAAGVLCRCMMEGGTLRCSRFSHQAKWFDA
jgi:hypothetical protein